MSVPQPSAAAAASAAGGGGGASASYSSVAGPGGGAGACGAALVGSGGAGISVAVFQVRGWQGASAHSRCARPPPRPLVGLLGSRGPLIIKGHTLWPSFMSRPTGLQSTASRMSEACPQLPWC
jgi:hypothetical protein